MAMPPLDISAFQPNTARGLNYPRAGLYFLQLDDPDKFASGLARLLQRGFFSAGDRRRTPRATVAFTAAGLRGLGLPDALVRCLGEAFNDGMAARAERLRDSGRNHPDRWQAPYGSAQVHVLLGVHVARVDADPLAALGRAFRRAAGNPENLFRDSLGCTLLACEAGRRSYAGSHRLPVNAFGFIDGLSQPVTTDAPGLLGRFLLDEPGASDPALLRQNPWAQVLADAQAADPRTGRLYRTWAALLTGGASLMAYRKIELLPSAFSAAADALAHAAQYRLPEAAALLTGRRADGMPLDGPARGDPARYNGFDFADDPAGAVHPLGSHVRRANPRRDRNPEVGLPHQGVDIATGPGGLPVGGHAMLRRGIRADDTAPGSPPGLHFIALVQDLERQFEFVQREWLNKGDFNGQPSAARDPLAATDGETTEFHPPGGGAPVAIEIASHLRGGGYFLVPGRAFIARLAADPRARPLPEVATRANDIASTSASDLVDPVDRLRPLVPLIRPGRRVAPSPAGFVVADWDNCVAVLNSPDLYASAHYRGRIRALTGGKDFALGMPANRAHARQRRTIETLLYGGDGPDGGLLPALPTDRSVDLLARVVWPRLVDLAEGFFGIAVPDTLSDIAIGDALGDTASGRFRHNYGGGWNRFFDLDRDDPEDRHAIKAANLASAVRRMGIYVIGFSESETIRGRALEAAETFRGWLVGDAGNEAVFQGLAVAACGTLEKASAAVIHRVMSDPRAAAVARRGPDGDPADPAQLEALVLEALRLDPVLPVFERDSTAATTLAGTAIPADARITLLAFAALRDPARFGADADLFSIDRDPACDGEMVFGSGAHLCSGDRFAVRFLVQLLQDLLSGYDLIPAAGPEAGPVAANAISNQPIALNVRVRRR